MPRRPALRRSSTPFPDATVERTTGSVEIDEGEWQLIASDIRNCIYAAQSARQPLEDNLRLFNRIYELYSEPRNEPFADSSSVFLPLAVSKLDALWAQVASKVFVPNLALVTGNGVPAQQVSYKLQRWYNNDFRRERYDQTSKLGESLQLLHWGLLEGTAGMDIRWNRQEQTELYDVEIPKQDDGGDLSFGDDGDFIMDSQEVQKILQLNEASWRCRQLKDWLLIPNESLNPHAAAAYAVCDWLYEEDLWALVESGNLKEEWVEKLLVFDPQGQSDVASDRQGYWDKSAGGQLQIGQGQGTLSSKQFANRGPFKIWYYVSSQFDMNHDGWAERNNVFWWAELSNYLLGWLPSKAVSQRRGLFLFAPMPRKNSPYGFSVLEREAPLNAELNTVFNNANDYVSLSLKPPMLADINNQSRDGDYTWALGKRWYVDDINTAFKPLVDYTNPAVLQGAYQMVQIITSFADQLVGQTAVGAGGLTSGRKSATEIKESSAGSGTRSDLIALFLRFVLRRALQYEHELNIQNLPDNPPADSDMPAKADFKQNVNIDVAGTGDPIDFQTYAQEYLTWYEMMSRDQDIQGDAEKRFALKQQLGRVFKIENLEAIIGTAEDAAQKKQGEDQAGQMKQQLEVQAAQAKIAHDLKGTPQEAAQAKEQQSPPPLDQQTQLAKEAMSQNGEAAPAGVS
jgi:hypothetical protein